MKNVIQLVIEDGTLDNNNGKRCKSLYHKKLTDGFKSNF
jgi:hypothetical protein